MIPEASEWVFFKNIDFKDPDINQFNVDTRDFHVGYTVESGIENLNLARLNNYSYFFHTPEEVLETLTRLFNDSKGDVEWRYLSLEGEAEPYTAGWELKYIRIIRTEMGWVMCNNKYRALNKRQLACPVNNKALNAY
jgi:hypothetical protein